MADTTTTNYGFVKPEVGASDDLWGGKLNTDLDSLDSTIKSVSTVANAAYPAANPSGYQTAANVTAVVPVASSTTPVMNGAAAVGTGTTWARADHVHPSDTAKLNLTGGTLTGALNGTTAGFSGAVACTSLLGGGNLYPSFATLNDFYLSSSGNVRIVQLAAGYTIQGDPTNSRTLIYEGGGLACTFDTTGSITVTGGGYKPGGGTWTAPSDARIKTVQGDYTQGLDAILALEPVVYTYKGNDAAEGEASPHGRQAKAATPFIGLIAQAVELVMPEMVTQGEGWIDGVKVADLRVLDTTPLIFALVNAVKTLTARVEELEAASG
jgi:hypothetical protein